MLRQRLDLGLLRTPVPRLGLRSLARRFETLATLTLARGVTGEVGAESKFGFRTLHVAYLGMGGKLTYSPDGTLKRLLPKPPLDAHTHTMLWVTSLPSHNM